MDEIYGQIRKLFVNFARGRGLSPEEAEDFAAELIRRPRANKKLVAKGNPAPDELRKFAWGIAWNLIIEFHRRKANRKEVPLEGPDGTVREFPDPHPNPLTQAILNERAAALNRQVRALGEPCVTVLFLWMEDYPAGQILDNVNQLGGKPIPTENAINKRVFDCLEKLRKPKVKKVLFPWSWK